MAIITDLKARSLKDKESLTEVLGRNRGAWVIRRVGNTSTAYYRYFKGKTKKQLSLGIFKSTASSTGFSVKQLREKAVEMAETRQQCAPVDLKEHLQKQEVINQQKREEEARKGTLQNLLEAYIIDMQDRGRGKAREYNRIFQKDVIYPSPLKLLPRWLHSATAPALLYLFASMQSSLTPITYYL